MDRSGSKASTGGPWGRLAQPEDPEGGRLVYHQPSEGWISIGFIHKTSFSRSAFIKVFAIDQIQSTSISKQIKLDKQLNSRISGLICTNIRPYIGSYGTLLALYHAYQPQIGHIKGRYQITNRKYQIPFSSPNSVTFYQRDDNFRRFPLISSHFILN